jgi:hypothetical protein
MNLTLHLEEAFFKGKSSYMDLMHAFFLKVRVDTIGGIWMDTWILKSISSWYEMRSRESRSARLSLKKGGKEPTIKIKKHKNSLIWPQKDYS